MRMGSAPVPSRVTNPVWQLTPIWHPSPNFGARRNGLKPELVVLHYTAMQSCEGARDWLCNPASEVSAHYLIDRDGTVIQMIDEPMRAWHAGAGGWRGKGDVNSRSIGIELANTGAEPYPEPQMRSLEGLLPAILMRWNIPAAGVIGHSDMAPGRKIDPGPRFDWQRLALQGLARPSVAASPVVPDPDQFFELLTYLGYPDADPEARLHAFRLRFASQEKGPLNAVDMGQAQALAGKFS